MCATALQSLGVIIQARYQDLCLFMTLFCLLLLLRLSPPMQNKAEARNRNTRCIISFLFLFNFLESKDSRLFPAPFVPLLSPFIGAFSVASLSDHNNIGVIGSLRY